MARLKIERNERSVTGRWRGIQAILHLLMKMSCTVQGFDRSHNSIACLFCINFHAESFFACFRAVAFFLHSFTSFSIYSRVPIYIVDYYPLFPFHFLHFTRCAR